tara:strand:+ start:443 stop:676 length:234 start_codon:yes stop_codon:yes gene_type:complete
MISSNKDDTLETILAKIQTPKDLKQRLGVYGMFSITHRHSIGHINIYIQLKDPKLWKEIRKIYYPNFFDKVKKMFGL